MKSSPKTPAAPDPAATAAAQTASNKDTAYWNAVLNNVNQITPYGNLTYTQTGGGKKYNMDGFNAAMDAYTKAITAGAATIPQGVVKQGDFWFNQKTGEYLPKEEGAKLNGAGQTVTAPKLEDYLIGDAPPQFTSEIKLSPEQQKILDSQTSNEQAMLGLGGEQISRIRDAVSKPFSFDGLPEVFGGQSQQDSIARAEEAIMSRLNPQFSRDEEALRSRLINQGIGQGSDAYNREFETFNQMKNDARQQAILGGQQYGNTAVNESMSKRNQAIAEYLQKRNAPLNEYAGIVSGTGVQNPTFQNTDYTGAAGTDIAGLINQNYNNQMNQYNAKVAQGNQLPNALFGLAGSIGGGFAGSKAGSTAIANWLFK